MWTHRRLGHAALALIHVILSVILAEDDQLADALKALAAAIKYGVLTSGGHGKERHHPRSAGDQSGTGAGSA